MNPDKQRDALQTIFSFFLGLMILAFIGVGVNTFLPEPHQAFQEELQDLYDQQGRLDRARDSTGKLTASQQAEYDRLQEQIQDVNQQVEDRRRTWARDTSIILVAFATLVMAISLVRSEQLRLLSNGLLLGGLFTMIYGTGWSIFSGDDVVRFIVVAVALLVSIVLGYLKFVRTRVRAAEVPAPAPGVTVAAEAGAPAAGIHEFAALAARVTEIERRASVAAAALGGERREEGADG